MPPENPVALTLFIDPAIAGPLLDRIVNAALPISVSSVSSIVQTQAHAIRAIEHQLRDLGRELEETKRQLAEAQSRLQFP